MPVNCEAVIRGIHVTAIGKAVWSHGARQTLNSGSTHLAPPLNLYGSCLPVYKLGVSWIDCKEWMR